MIKLRKILLYKSLYIIIFLISIIYTTIYLNINTVSKYKGNEKVIEGKVLTKDVTKNKVTFLIFGKEKVLATYYPKEDKSNTLSNISLGDKVILKGTLVKPFSNKNFYSFNYPKYLKRQKIFYLMKVDSFKKISSNKNIIYKLRTYLRKSIKDDKVGSYIKIFFLGDTSNFNNALKLDFQKLGISHLFALSGTQISCLIFLFNKLFSLFKINSFKMYLAICLLLCCYYMCINSCAAIDRAVVFSFIFMSNKTFNLNILPSFLILLSLSILLFINPYYIFDIGFQYSTVISCILIIYMKNEKKGKIIELLKISWVSFLSSLPISLYHFSYINILSIIYNIFYVPLINIIIFPFAIICFFIPKLSIILSIFINIFEYSVKFLSNIKIGVIVFKRLNIIYYFLLFILIICYLSFKNRKLIMLSLLIIILTTHYFIPKLISEDSLYMLDIGQGDCFLLRSDNKNMLIDTSGVMDYYNSDNKANKGHFVVQFLYQLGINKLDYILLSHGDYDHAGETLNIVKEIKVDSILFNSNSLNNLEKEIWNSTKVFKYKLKEGDSFKLGNFNFQVISGNFKDENDSSTILYTTIYDNKIIFTGDASIKSEEYVLKKYNIENITILKVGHHGSKTSSSEKFIATTNPKYALISAGVDNKFNHPSDIVVKRLLNNNVIIYDVRKKGMVKFNFKEGNIKTYK